MSGFVNLYIIQMGEEVITIVKSLGVLHLYRGVRRNSILDFLYVAADNANKDLPLAGVMRLLLGEEKPPQGGFFYFRSKEQEKSCELASTSIDTDLH